MCRGSVRAMCVWGVVLGMALAASDTFGGVKELKVQATTSVGAAVAGGSDYAIILVLVTYKGGGVNRLAEDNFELDTCTMPIGGNELEIVNFQAMGGGAYVLFVDPTGAVTWYRGAYLCHITVTLGRKEGHALAKTEIP